jgi:hypothetical protein
MPLFRKPKPEMDTFPPDLLAEASLFPDGWVYEIDGRYDRDDAVPGYAIRRGWRVGPDGKPTGEYRDNPSYGEKTPLSEVRQIICEARTQASGSSMVLLVVEPLHLDGSDIQFDVGITIVLDEVLAMGFTPTEPEWMSMIDGGRKYTFVRDG